MTKQICNLDNSVNLKVKTAVLVPTIYLDNKVINNVKYYFRHIPSLSFHIMERQTTASTVQRTERKGLGYSRNPQ